MRSMAVETEAAQGPCLVSVTTSSLTGRQKAYRQLTGRRPFSRSYVTPDSQRHAASAQAVKMPVARIREDGTNVHTSARVGGMRVPCSTADFNHIRHSYDNYSHYRKSSESALPPITAARQRVLSADKTCDPVRSSSVHMRSPVRSRSCLAGRMFGGRTPLSDTHENANTIKGYRVLGNSMLHNRRSITNSPAVISPYGASPVYRTAGDTMIAKRDGLVDKLCEIFNTDRTDAVNDVRVRGCQKTTNPRANYMTTAANVRGAERDKRVRFSDELTAENPSVVTTYVMAPHPSTLSPDCDNGSFILTRRNVELFEYLTAPDHCDDSVKTGPLKLTNQRVLDWVLQRQLYVRADGMYNVAEDEERSESDVTNDEIE